MPPLWLGEGHTALDGERDDLYEGRPQRGDERHEAICERTHKEVEQMSSSEVMRIIRSEVEREITNPLEIEKTVKARCILETAMQGFIKQIPVPRLKELGWYEQYLRNLPIYERKKIEEREIKETNGETEKNKASETQDRG